MDYQQGRAMMNGFTPNGLLPNKASSLTKELERNRCYELEKRTTLLLNQILPTQHLEELRNSVVSYLRRLIMNSVPCQVFIFGSVPLKTYLPDGDIDLTAFSDNQDFKDSLVHAVRGVLESERKNVNAEFQVKEVHYIEAEVTILKCLVDKFVVDISFNQISGLCTLCFLEEVDHLIARYHLFKRSIILIKAWCFHESRILGAQHGLISSYALEVLVLYIFLIYSDKFAYAGPLEVLFRFLDFFSKFDWKNYVISLWGPIPISSIPNMIAEPPRNDCRELLLQGEFLIACKIFYGVTPRSQEPFVAKHLNIVDPLCENNNLGRSISKGNFCRIKSAFTLGAQRLMRLFDCTKEKITAEFDYFFKNTWDRHGNGHWMEFHRYNQYLRNNTAENSTHNESVVEQAQASHRTVPQNPMFETTDVSSVTWSTRNGDMKRALIDKGKCPMYPSNEVHAMPQLPSQYWRSEDYYGLSVDEAMRMHHGECDLMYLTDTFKNHSFHGYLQAPFNVMNSSNLPFPSPPPPFSPLPPHGSLPPLPGFTPAAPPPGFSPLPPHGSLQRQPPLPGFTPAPPPPGFEHAKPYGVPPVNVPSWSYNMPYSDHDNSSEGFWSGQDLGGGSSSSNSSFWNSSGTSYLPRDYWDTPEPKWLARENNSDYSLPSNSRMGIVTSNVQDNQLASHMKWPMVVPNSSRFSPGSSQRGFDNPWLSSFAFGPSRPPPVTYAPLNCMDMNSDLINLNSAQKSRQSSPFLMPNYSSLDATSEPCVVSLVPDILKADFLSHWLNLQHARLCENPQLKGHFPYLLAPPFYYPPLPAYSPWDVAPRRPADFMNNMPYVPPPLLYSIMPNQFPHHGFNPSLNNHNVDLAHGHGRGGGIGTFLPDPVSYQNRYYKRRSHSITKNEDGNNGFKRNEDRKGDHHHFYSPERYRQSVHFSNFRCHTKQHYKRRDNEAASHTSVFDNNSDVIVVVPDNNEDSPDHMDGTNEASNKGESSQSASNEMEKVEGDSADPCPPQPPASDSPETQDEDVSIFNDADFPRLC